MPSSGNYDDWMALGAKASGDTQNKAAADLAALGAAPVSARALPDNMAQLGRTNIQLAQIYAQHVVFSEKMNTLEANRKKLAASTAQLADNLGTPTCGDVAQLG